MGYFRFIMALVVCSNHLSSIGGAGRYAVFSFYVLSGFLMTTIINDKYGLSTSGIAKYALNRVLRIYPTYSLVFIVTSLSLILFNERSSSLIEPTFKLPTTYLSIINNIFLVGMNFMHMERVIPPAWTLYVELSFYAIIPLIMTLGRRAVWAWFFISILYHVVVAWGSNYPGFDWNMRYGTVMAGSLGFSIGCLASTYKKLLKINKIAGLSSISAIAAIHVFTTSWFGRQAPDVVYFLISMPLYYVNMALSAISVLYLFSVKESGISRRIGEFSYPVYLTHIPCCYVIFIMSGMPIKSFQLFISSMVLTIAVSYFLVLMERKINIIRRKVKC